MSAARKLRREIGNHAVKVMRLARESNLRPGTVNQVLVMHDDGCRIFKGKPCDCEPDVKFVTHPDPESN
jgi:hypothetical protein